MCFMCFMCFMWFMCFMCFTDASLACWALFFFFFSFSMRFSFLSFVSDMSIKVAESVCVSSRQLYIVSFFLLLKQWKFSFSFFSFFWRLLLLKSWKTTRISLKEFFLYPVGYWKSHGVSKIPWALENLVPSPVHFVVLSYLLNELS